MNSQDWKLVIGGTALMMLGVMLVVLLIGMVLAP